ncbi:IclR family transcriptional regulator C-terminal domain-containing protein [Actinomadura graeca]|uniref:IclR family transcriptional regulator C-terminal domain-containing protein n=1 Tax=Actinomadura graeca TaxID=2750812 RepID=UPI001E5FD7D7|nr:IclR family transcriptional regulator C-terminal domain-containing protein [Actinomadura graeca]
MAQLDDSVVYRILQSGVRSGMFAKVGRGRYRPGSRAAQFGAQALLRAPSAEAVSEPLRELRDATDGGPAFLLALTYFGGLHLQCAASALSDSDLKKLDTAPRGILKANQHFACGTAGRAILPFLPEHSREWLAIDVTAGAGEGAGAPGDAELCASLEQVGRKGYAVGAGEEETGWCSYAAPVFWDCSIMGAVLLLKPVSAPSPGADRCGEATRAAAGKISQLLSSDPAGTPARRVPLGLHGIDGRRAGLST